MSRTSQQPLLDCFFSNTIGVEKNPDTCSTGTGRNSEYTVCGRKRTFHIYVTTTVGPGTGTVRVYIGISLWHLVDSCIMPILWYKICQNLQYYRWIPVFNHTSDVYVRNLRTSFLRKLFVFKTNYSTVPMYGNCDCKVWNQSHSMPVFSQIIAPVYSVSVLLMWYVKHTYKLVST
jgi:hypothetical protein